MRKNFKNGKIIINVKREKRVKRGSQQAFTGNGAT